MENETIRTKSAKYYIDGRDVSGQMCLLAAALCGEKLPPGVSERRFKISEIASVAESNGLLKGVAEGKHLADGSFKPSSRCYSALGKLLTHYSGKTFTVAGYGRFLFKKLPGERSSGYVLQSLAAGGLEARAGVPGGFPKPSGRAKTRRALLDPKMRTVAFDLALTPDAKDVRISLRINDRRAELVYAVRDGGACCDAK